MPDLMSRIQLLAEQLDTAHSEDRTDAAAIVSAINDLKDALTGIFDIPLSDVRNSIESLRSDMVIFFAASNDKLDQVNINLDYILTNASLNAQRQLALTTSGICCDVVLSLPAENTPDANACARAGWATTAPGGIIVQAATWRRGGNFLTPGYVRTYMAGWFDTDGALHTAPDDYAASVAATANACPDAVLLDLADTYAGGLKDGIRNAIANASDVAAAVTDVGAWVDGFDYAPTGKAFVKAVYSATFINDVYGATFDFSAFDNDACGSAPEFDYDCVGGSSGTWLGHFTAANTAYPFNSFSGNKKVHWECPTAPSGQAITILNHDDSDSEVVTIVENQVAHLLDGVNYYWKASIADSTENYSYCAKPEA